MGVSTMDELETMRQNNRNDNPVGTKEIVEPTTDKDYIKSILEKWQSLQYVGDAEKCNVCCYLFDEINNIKEELKNGK